MGGMTPIVLAAGASTRMGRPKALLDFDGRVCLDLVLDAVRPAGRPIVVLGPNHEEIRRRVDLGAVDVVLNLDVESGQTASLQAALRQLPAGTAAFLMTPVDLPLLRASEVDALLRAWKTGAGRGTSLYIPSHAMKRGHPILCSRELADEFLELRPGASARDVLHRRPERIAYVDFPDTYVLMDMDTPEDYRRCLEAYRTREAKSP
jgi:CTP:molybdopterin cytidylyltransferase MocA